MDNLLEDFDLWEVTSLDVRPIKISQADLDLRDQKAKGLIRLFLGDSILLNVLDEKTTNSLWTWLGFVYQAKSMVNKLFLRKNLYSLRMEEGRSIIDQLNDFNLLIA